MILLYSLYNSVKMDKYGAAMTDYEMIVKVNEILRDLKHIQHCQETVSTGGAVVTFITPVMKRAHRLK